MPEVKWVMLCPMARTGSSHTSELLDRQPGTRSHHGLFNDGPFGRWPADEHIPLEKRDYYSATLDANYRRIGGEERSGEFLDRYIFTDDPRYNPTGWRCIGFKVQYVHLVNMPDLRQYLIDNKDIRIILNNRRDLLEHACAEHWCQNGNSRAARNGESYQFGKTDAVKLEPVKLADTFRNLCRYREDVVNTFAKDRKFMEWSLEDMFDAQGSLDVDNHKLLLEFLDIEPSETLTSTFTQTPRPSAREYLINYDELASYFADYKGGVFGKYFQDDWDPRADKSWPVLDDYDLDSIMAVKDNTDYRHGERSSI